MITRAVILAAGASQRMGRAKALLEFRGRTFLDGVIECMRAAGVDEIVVVTGGVHGAACRERCAAAGVKSVENPHPERGQMSSVRIGIEASGRTMPNAFLIHPVDIPGVRESDVRELIAAMDRAPHALVAFPSVGGRRGHPVILRRELALQAASLGAEATLRDLLACASEERIVYVERDNPLLRHDVDTEEDYRGLIQWDERAKAEPWRE